MTEAATPIRFGFLLLKWEFKFDYGEVIVVPGFDDEAKSLEKQLHKDGYYYPPMVKTVVRSLDGKNSRTVPKTTRPARLYPVPASHQLNIAPNTPEANIREGAAGFVIHFLAFLFQTRLQFSDWLIDGRIPMKRNRVLMNTPNEASVCLSHAFKIWSGWCDADKKRFISILFIHSRSAVYQWGWEEFMIQYMVLDACWKMAESLFDIKAKSHSDRANVLCKIFSLGLDNSFIDLNAMVKLRNDLFHESLWFQNRPGASIGRLPYHMPMRMRIMNQLLIVGLIEQAWVDEFKRRLF